MGRHIHTINPQAHFWRSKLAEAPYFLAEKTPFLYTIRTNKAIFIDRKIAINIAIPPRTFRVVLYF